MATAIIDYRMGNLRSVQKAFQHVGADAAIVAEPPDVNDVTKLVLPGVGAFADGMQHLREMGWVQFINDFIATGKPFLGICLGMQLLFDGSQEDAPSPDQPVDGLGVLPGQVVAFTQPSDPAKRIKIPHMGWNTLTVDAENPLFAGISDGEACYFVHGYYCKPNDDSLISATCEYPVGDPFCAAARKSNIFATQFHPEKSQRVGLRMLANFAAL